jgi:thioredoxin reductase (NADPH)
MCPDLVKAAQRIAAENPHITAQVYDLRHFEGLKKQYNVMSVPCLVINDEQVFFGKKNIQQILELISSKG